MRAVSDREIIRTFDLDGISSAFSIRSESNYGQSSKSPTHRGPTAAELIFEMHEVGEEARGETSAEDLPF